MREILFRGKWTRNDKWIEGFYARIHDGKGNVSHRIYSGYAESDCGEFYPENFEVDPSTVGQYTGLTDKNGKKIFEGDIVRHYNRFDDDMAHETGLIFYDSKQCRFKRTSIHGEVYLGEHCRYEVIGNIFDNPELLEDEG